ncbi:MAG: hybrid sensor histidine kinase/response regulator [Campylobacterota bacterium]|nr:hybrid sensor histidine kinase/response regulator [Campylobacterota bacterium]
MPYNLSQSNETEILAVDDTPANLKLLTSLLSVNGYKVRPASSGEMALRSVEHKQPDIILLDIRMPNMDGFEVCRRLKSSDISKNIPVIFISAMDDISDKVKAFSVGGIDYVTKPFEPEEVLARINTHITLRTLQKELQSQNIILKELMKKQQEQEHMLIEQSKMAAMGEMISAIAHQWRQPLNTLALYIQDIEGAYEDDALNDKYINNTISQSMKQINFMSSTIDDFRNFFTPNKDKEHFLVMEQINKTIDLLKAQLKSHHITISVKGDDVTLFGLAHELQQVVLNLINNSKDAIITSQEKNSALDAKIEITCSKNSEFFELIVADNGCGIESNIIEKIFEPYFTTKFPKHGTGVGLYMVKEIVENHYLGSIEVTSSNNQTEFKIKIPYLKSS